MTDQNLAKDLVQYTEWSGSRADLIALIERLEKAEPRARMLQSKVPRLCCPSTLGGFSGS